ncbi:MAG: class I SAM-dependent methyltransferase [Minwuia sp.]|nr:class I SAM-dependent methyltransferase [Minwuia sp.]
MAKAALKNRIKAWWAGYPVDAGGKAGLSAHHRDQVRRHCPYGPLADTLSILFGQAHHQPGGTDFLYRIIGDHVPIKEQKALVIGCGMGGNCRDIAERYQMRTEGLDPNRELLRAGNEMIQETVRGKVVRLDPVDLAHMDFGAGRYHLIVARETMHAQPDRHSIYERIEQSLRRNGRMVCTQLVVNDGTDADTLSERMCTALEPKPATFLTRDQERRCLVEVGLEVVHEEDVTDEVLKSTIEVFANWQRAVETMARYIEQPRMLQELVRIVDHWQRRSDAMKNGELGITLFHAAKRSNELL